MNAIHKMEYIKLLRISSVIVLLALRSSAITQASESVIPRLSFLISNEKYTIVNDF